VQGAGDEVALQEIKGTARISGEFDSVKLAKIGQAVSFKSARTDLEFARLDGDLDMDQGDLRASDLAGPFRLLTRSKDIRLTGMSGDVRLQNENGAIEVHMNKLGSMELSNRNSEIEVYLPDNAGFQLEAHVRGGEVESDFKDLKVENGNDNGSASGTVGGGGPRLVLNSEHGTISIHKGSALAEAPMPPQPPAVPHPPKVPHPPAVPQETEN
jgi:Putative adhesin